MLRVGILTLDVCRDTCHDYWNHLLLNFLSDGGVATIRTYNTRLSMAQRDSIQHVFCLLPEIPNMEKCPVFCPLPDTPKELSRAVFSWLRIIYLSAIFLCHFHEFTPHSRLSMDREDRIAVAQVKNLCQSLHHHRPKMRHSSLCQLFDLLFFMSPARRLRALMEQAQIQGSVPSRSDVLPEQHQGLLHQPVNPRNSLLYSR
ncbi:uncharacterized protein B0T23DRAFT_103268 [Neurospora hispaniola]|uniref:Uncharacterized protein n=1 Tax=Neurospora hispaniola TaxID=588809 RepID=A0AAJ0MRZ2_9PEZI|nr:hypothetical protein B0T23DRAFT_103268 [Neurospora hispaniola]